MKLTRSIIATVIITLLAFGATVYTSCTKDRCQNVACQNGGGCVNGYCSCPTGYSGDHCEVPATTTIVYYNHTYTDITLTLNNVAYTVTAGHSKGFTGGYNDTLSGNAFTSGAYGETIQWDSVQNTFPISGTTTVDFHVDSNYFFLFVQNDSSSSLIREIIVDNGVLNNVNGLPAERDMIFPTFIGYQQQVMLGYFYATKGSNVIMKSNTGGVFNFPAVAGTSLLAEPMTQDQYYGAVAP